jgi:membrane protease YdiL (CAAX protease family)
MAEPESPLHRLVFGRWGVRAGWRIALWVTAVYALLVLQAGVLRAAGVPLGFALQVGMELSAGLMAGLALLMALDRRSPGALGFAADPAAPRQSALGFALGGAAIAAAAGLLAASGHAYWIADTGGAADYLAALARGLVFFACAAAAEEVLFRGYGFQALVQGIGAWPAVLLSSAAFSLAHARNPAVDAVALANIFAAGVMLGWAYLRTRSLWFCTGVHLGWNWTMSALLDFPVSGLVRDTPLYDERSLGPRWLSGGAFGPEGGVAATLVIVLLTLLLLRWRGLAPSPRSAALRPLVDDRLGPGR